jgi:hypothetical protein
VGCATFSDVAFVRDDRVKAVEPKDFATVATPVQFAWKGHLRAGEQYAVFVDRAPIRPGQEIVAVTDDACRRRPGCPTADELAPLGVYVVRAPRLKLLAFPVSGNDRRTTHEITIVIVDGSGRRTDEAAETVILREGSAGQ